MKKNENPLSIRIAGLVSESVVDGPGLRFVVFAQGCPHRCSGCHNPETWDHGAGELILISEVLAEIDQNKLLSGVTLSGGEPFEQASGFAVLAKAVRDRGLNVIVYSGYTWEEITAKALVEKAVDELLKLSDYLVDGPYVDEEKDLSLSFRGSRNQRFINVQKSLLYGAVVEMDFSIPSIGA